MLTSELAIGLVAADAGAFSQLRKLGVRRLIRGEETGGNLAVVEYLLPPHSLGSPVHTHAREDEITYVAEGTSGVLIGDEVYEAGPGATIRKPRGIPHAFWNPGDTPARLLEILTPAGFERYFEELAAALIASDGGQPDQQQVSAIQERYGLSMDNTSIPMLAQRFGLIL
jgi:quercetin dioxygenase-like cupin family protein